jgi:hypothetical protein
MEGGEGDPGSCLQMQGRLGGDHKLVSRGWGRWAEENRVDRSRSAGEDGGEGE